MTLFILIMVLLGVIMVGAALPQIMNIVDRSGINWDQVDADNGKSIGNIQWAILSQAVFLLLILILIRLFSTIMVCLITGAGFWSTLFSSGWTPLLFGFFLAGYHWLIWGFNPENTVRGVVNVFKPEFNTLGRGDDDGGNRLMIFRQGIFIRPFGASLGLITDSERERSCKSDQFVTTVKGVSLEMVVSFTWLPNLERISRWFQNGKTEKEREKIIKFIMTAATQAIEESAEALVKKAKIRDMKKAASYARVHQTEMIEEALKAARSEARRYGVTIVAMKFEKCDFTGKTQESLDAIMESKGLAEVAKTIKKLGKDEALLAAVIMGAKGAEIKQTNFGISTDDNVSGIAQMVADHPEIATALAALASKKGK